MNSLLLSVKIHSHLGPCYSQASMPASDQRTTSQVLLERVKAHTLDALGTEDRVKLFCSQHAGGDGKCIRSMTASHLANSSPSMFPHFPRERAHTGGDAQAPESVKMQAAPGGFGETAPECAKLQAALQLAECRSAVEEWENLIKQQ